MAGVAGLRVPQAKGTNQIVDQSCYKDARPKKVFTENCSILSFRYKQISDYYKIQNTYY